MIRYVFLGLLLWMGVYSLRAQPTVPTTFTYCGIEVTLSRGARERVQSHVDKIYESSSYLNQMVRRARTYFPFIEEAFEDQKVPLDLKYLCIQESALKPDAISMSNAVGFWQFKKESALEVGLVVDKYVDERKHIYKASLAAANYFARNNQDFDNWIYAIISYYEGPTGAVPFTDPQYYGRKKITIDHDFHWYALKSIAHKIAYQPLLEEDIQANFYLMPYLTSGQKSWKEVYELHNISEEEFLAHNHWIDDLRKLPYGAEFTYYIPISPAEYQGHLEDPSKIAEIAMNSPIRDLSPSGNIDVFQPAAPAPTEEETKLSQTDLPGTESQTQTDAPPSRPVFRDRYSAQPYTQLHEDQYAVFRVQDDLHYGTAFALYKGEQSFEAFSADHLEFPSDLLEYNKLPSTSALTPPSIIYLEKAKKVPFHVVESGERLPDIAHKHNTSVSKILSKNRMSESNTTIYEGQKLYLKSKKPKGEKIIILTYDPPEIGITTDDSSLSETSSTEASTSETLPLDNTVQTPTHTSDKPELIGEDLPVSNQLTDSTENENIPPKPSFPPVQELPSKWIEHTVTPGETLWSISQRYGTKVEIIKRVNKLTSEGIYEGQTLRIFAKKGMMRSMQ